MKKEYVLDRGYMVLDIHISYEEGAYDETSFESLEEAKDYARKSLYLLDDDEYFDIYEVVNNDWEYVATIEKED
jgi:hypothetical protein